MRDSVKVTLLLLLSRREEIDGVERGDDLAADYEFFQIVAIPKRLIIQEAQPKFGVIGFCFRAFERSGIEHGTLLSNGHATASGGNPKHQSPSSKKGRALRDLELGFGISRAARGRVTDGTRTRNSQNHNLELYH